ncbi:toll/interleukin-1 receptor domain-containing adapter protein isoform X1 [Desmodus rotundus]|uniref:toll/interleukin-1 receptor domain-containing adapter protein isoform X1 n=2 Tax=Desmodus rotundus TaxID=9430 RepID=UPI002381167E|nr:toll/interleukin-1 receptor domain-containing adapter protein isoform X1 [Desmodus rotundus]XP_053783806.1 toll/interleukin-1 receptor domain-containing adapter protein isoform X1 [Desmodus rotundus]XP_053783807.1 toll/interleukin-1 receptor domain-containing adapter protein isoform X1 [Desmodus rotundus]XP_053783808.1 toll/interleukin-1 receptor domain-containing adapter protein isoform X1 [Desmodus rotundus]XP_053783809.1 toll/interleukin-1 receptor domain-containing adapter protein isofor
MASPTSFPASGSRSKKPLGKMAGWLRQALSKKPKKMPASQESPPSDAVPGCSRDDTPPPRLQEDPPPQCPQDHPASSGLNSAALAESPALPPAQEGATSSSGGRWSRDYDVCVCHSEEDLAAAQELVAYLEDCSASLRCFLQLRDAAPGGAIVSELCRALDSSHCQVLLITPGFQRDPWCRYQMLQALSQAPGAEGRTIPLLAGLARDAYPPELRFMYFVDGRGPERGFRQVKEAILRCKLCAKGTGKGSASDLLRLLGDSPCPPVG